MSINTVFNAGVLLGCVGGALGVAGYRGLLNGHPKRLICGLILLVGGGCLVKLAAEISASV